MANKFHRGKHTVTKHWLKNTMLAVLIVLLIIEILLVLAVRSYYYSAARQYMTSKMNIVTNAVMHNADDTTVNYNAEIRSVVESYADKDRIELMAVKTDGSIDITSSGFSPEKNVSMNDYTAAKQSSSGMATDVFELPSGEKVIAVTSMISARGSEFEALRMVSSMKGVDQQIVFIAVIITIVVAAVVLLIFFSGMFFIRSIVYPVLKIGGIARQFAKGDFSERIEKTSDDEIGELCDSINYMADELSNTEQMKNEFISSVSHELRTPLTAIKGWSETLTAVGGGDEETFKKGMRVITSETERLSQMVEELLDFSRIQDNRLQLQMATIDILAELGETVLIYQERARSLGIKLDYYEPEMLPFVYGDKNRLRQVFINIVDNAIKYSDKGDTVSVEAYEQDNEVVITVSDTGIGISKEDLPKIKTKFFKANHTRRGSGIGLAVADEIIARHDGTLTINSEQGVGTTVMITLPCIEQKKKSDEKETVNVELISNEITEHDK